jgi:alkylation response protein AidB-like acyl-CoA dehydrogenase
MEVKSCSSHWPYRLYRRERYPCGNCGVTSTANRLLADIRQLAPDITARAAEIEAGRRIPLDLVETLRSIGVFRMFVPQSHGGLELDLATGLDIITALGRIDGSVGWTAMIASGGSTFAPSLPRETYERVYQNGPDVIFAGSIQPAGTRGDSRRLAGQWTMAVRQRMPAC